MNLYFVITFKADESLKYEGLEQAIYEAVSSYGIELISQSIIMIELIIPQKRVFSGIKAILDFDIINFREYDCSKESGSPNCQIVELFLTVDTTRKMQNGVNIDKSIDRCDFFFDFYHAKTTFSEGWIF